MLRAPYPDRRVPRTIISLLVALSLVPLSSAPVRAQSSPSCVDTTEPTPEVYGPTDISATSGNQSLSVAVNPEATITVFKWPSPSFYDQIKYRTSDRSQPLMGALPNEGAFFGLAYRAGDRWRFSWLREWPSTQRFTRADSDEVRTVFRKRGAGLKVVVRDVVAHDRDALLRNVTVRRSRDSQVRRARLISFANFNPVYEKAVQAPLHDWCFEDDDDEGATYDDAVDAVVQFRSGTDESTGDESSLAIAFGFTEGAHAFQIGVDTYETSSAGTSAYDDASDGRLMNVDTATGQSDAALMRELSLRNRRTASTTAVVAVGADARRARAVLRKERSRTYADVVAAKSRWYRRWLVDAPLPKNAPRSIVRLARRSLVSLRQVIDAETEDVQPEGTSIPAGGSIVRSIATQAPYGQDWIRDGAYANRVLSEIGHGELVAHRNYRYAVLQHKAGDNMRGGSTIPPGNWAMNHYADGIVGGTIPYEIDETGYGIWTLWDHYARTRDRTYLLFEHGGIVYLAIQRAAQYLTDVCRDVATGLQCVASEGDSAEPSQTLYGALLVWLGLDSAVKAARVKGNEEALANADRWAARRDELAAAIERHFYDEECDCYTADAAIGGTLLWPVRYPVDDARAAAQAEENWRAIKGAFAGRTTRGGSEAKALLGNAVAWRGTTNMARVKRGLRWVAETASTDRTGLLGEAWMRYPQDDSPVVTMVSQPHVSQHALFYLAALEAYGRDR